MLPCYFFVLVGAEETDTEIGSILFLEEEEEEEELEVEGGIAAGLVVPKALTMLEGSSSSSSSSWSISASSSSSSKLDFINATEPFVAEGAAAELGLFGSGWFF